MCGISGFELVVILAAAIIFLGPERLPDVMRAAGRVARELRRLRGDLGQVTREITSSVGVDDLKESVRETLDVDRVRSRVKDAESEIDAIRARLKRPVGVAEAGRLPAGAQAREESPHPAAETSIEPPVPTSTPTRAEGSPADFSPSQPTSNVPNERPPLPTRVPPEQRLAEALAPPEDS
jgi:Tat protein translocase TatB subunit